MAEEEFPIGIGEDFEIEMPDEVFSMWEREYADPANVPTEEVRRLGLAMQIAYFAMMGPRAMEAYEKNRKLMRERYDTDHDRRRQWDYAARLLLKWQASQR